MELKNIFNRKEKISITEWNLPVKLFGALLGILIFAFFFPNSCSDQESTFEIPRGSSFNQVSEILYSEGIIPNRLNFKIAAFLTGAENKLKAGRYKIPSGLNYFDLIEYLLEGGHDEQILVTIPEGIWQHSLAKLLHEKLNVDSATFMNLSKDKIFLAKLGVEVKSLEGYLLPETYYFYTNSSAEEVINKLHSEMKKIFSEEVDSRLQELKMTRNQILTLASIIEGESNIPSEFKKISGVYHNRLKKWMMLEADPTIQYLKRDKKHNRILYGDLELDSPYNTYKNYGLPPTPINNPGKEAVLAALYPEEHNFLFFVADGKGAHRFAKTYSEHLQNVQLYRKWRNSQ